MSKTFLTLPLANLLPFHDGHESLKTYAPSPVWKNSTTSALKFAPMSKKQAAKLWHEARRFERNTRVAGKQDGALGRNGLAVLYVLLFDFLNYGCGRLDPAKATIAKAANISERSAARGLANLKAWGVVNWVRRCAVDIGEAGRAVFRQLSNAYAVLPVSQWLGHTPKPEAPPPARSVWGAAPIMPTILEEAAAAATITDKIRVLDLDPNDSVARVLAQLGRAMQGQENGSFSERPA